MHSYTIETERLILRPLFESDAEAEFVWLSDPVVNRFMPYNLYTSVEEARAWLRSIQDAHLKDDYQFGFERKADGLLIGAGSIGLSKDKLPGYWGFGYNLRRDCWNQGYVTEATRAMIDFAHRTFGAKDFCATHAVDNPASGRVMEKCGCVFHSLTEYSTFDGTETFPAKTWVLHLEV